MNAAVLTATRADGAGVAPGRVKSLRISASIDSPAAGMTAVIVSENPARTREIFTALRVYHKDALLFEGALDSQKVVAGSGGILLELDARSAGAVLLDNEAQPCQMQNARAADVFRRFISPYGFAMLAPGGGAALPVYTVRAGTSEWDAFADFARRVYGIAPYVSGTNVVVGRPDSGAQPFAISNAGGARFASLIHEYIPYNIISSVYLRDAEGAYSTAVHNSAAAVTGLRRRRFAVPANEYADNRGQDANFRIRRSMFESERIFADLPGIHEVSLGADAAVTDENLAAHNLMVSKREFIFGADGIFTRLTLQSSLYYS